MPSFAILSAGNFAKMLLPWDMVGNSISLCTPISGWFFRAEAVWTDHLTLE